MLTINIAHKTTMLAILLCNLAAYADSANPGNQLNSKPAPDIRNEYSVQSIIYNEADRKLYVFGHMITFNANVDEIATTGVSKIVRFSEYGKLEEKIPAAYFGLEHYSNQEHKHDADTKQTWFVDPVHNQYLSFDGNPAKAWAEFSRLLKQAKNPEIFLDPGKMPIYGFLVSITQSPKRIWVTTRSGGGGPYAWARDEKNGLLWEGDEGILKIYVDGTSQATIIRQDDFVSAIYPDERDGTAWVYLSHKNGELRHIDRSGKILSTLLIGKYKGATTAIVIDFRRDILWYSNQSPFQLVKMSLGGARLMEITDSQISGKESKRWCNNPKLTSQVTDGTIWLYCKAYGLIKLDSSGKQLFSVPSGF